MDGNSTEDYGMGRPSSPMEEISAGQRCQSVDSLAEWRSSEQVENGTPSTSPPYWDTDGDDDDDDDDDDCGPRPSELYGKFTWKIENFSQISKRELRSNAFEVGGYKWYILIYPQGCDVCNHLSLFLCVANHDKLLPGWSHFAQFTIAVVNKDPKKSKHSDTLHRFWKKEHDWGWKKFMELSKVLDGFINSDTLIIKAQVQVIREKAHCPFHCLDRQYRRELVRVYLSNVEQSCGHFAEDRKSKLKKLIEDKMRWSSFCAFWLGIDQNSRRCISRDKADTILRIVVKHFFVEKEVTSTLVMDSLYSGLKALECQSKKSNGRRDIEMEESLAPAIRVDNDMFVLADDLLLLLERVASEPLPTLSLPSKDGKVFQSRAKEGSSGEEFNKDSIECVERHLTELGRRTLEIFVLAHIFNSRIEVAYQEAVALKRQEELIREEEAAGQADNELRAKRAAAEKDKRTKKKQAKQKRNNLKSKEKQRDLTSVSVLNDKLQENSLDEIASEELSTKLKRVDTPEDASDISYTCDDVAEPLYPDLEDRASNLLNWDMDTSEEHPSMEHSAGEISNDMQEKKSPVTDDSSSTCSTDSIPSVVSNGPYKGNFVIINKSQNLPNRAKNHLDKNSQKCPSLLSYSGQILGSCTSIRLDFESDAVSLKHSTGWPESHLVEKQKAAATPDKKALEGHGNAERLPNIWNLESSPASSEPGTKSQLLLQQAKQSLRNSATATNAKAASTNAPSPNKESLSSNLNVPKRSAVLPAKSLKSSTSVPAQKLTATPATKNIAVQLSTVISGPSSTPLIPAERRLNTPAISTLEVMPHILCSVSATGGLSPDPSPSATGCVPQSYRNAIIGKSSMGSRPSMASSPAGLTHPASASIIQAFTSSSQSTTSSTSASMLPSPSATRKEQQIASRPGFAFGSVKPEALHIQQQQRFDCMHHAPASSCITTATPTTSSGLLNLNLVRSIERLDICPEKWPEQHQKESPSSTSLFQSYGAVADEFPHLDIINELLNEEHTSMGRAANISSQYHLHQQRHHSFRRQYSFPGDVASADLGTLNNSSGRFDQAEQYYDDGFQRIYGSTSSCAHPRLQDSVFTQIDLSAAYSNVQVDGLIQSQWPYGHADLSIMNPVGVYGGGYSNYSDHHLFDYANPGSGLNGYGLYWP